MAVQIISGSAGAGKTTTLLKKMIAASMKEPERRFFVVVPEQSTMETQRKLVELHPRNCILNLEVTSLNRLAYRVFNEVGFLRESLLEETGKTFLLEKIALEKKQQLPYLGRNLARPEFLAEMKSLLSELMLYDVNPEQLERAIAHAGGGYGVKMADVLTVYRAFLEKMEGSFFTAEAVPDRFCAMAEKSSLLRGSVLALDGFTGFTPVQYRLLGALMPIVEDMYVTAAIPAERDPLGHFRQTDLFAMGFEMAQTLRRLAGQAGVTMLPTECVAVTEHSRAASSPELLFLEKHLLRTGTAVYTGKGERPTASGESANRDIHILEAGNPREEMEAAAREISRLVREEGLRYRDIAIVTGDLASYGIYAAEVMQLYGIPCFVDEKRPLLRNPLIEYLRAALETCADQYSHDSMFRMLKSGMTDFTDEEIEHLENYALGTGLRGKKRWREHFLYTYKGEDETELPMLDDVRGRVCELLDPLSDALAKRGGTVREKAAALFEFCEKSQAEQRVREAEAFYRENGRPDLAREYAQVYPYFCGFLDKLVSVLGDESISMTDFRALLESGFAEARVAIIPPGNDRVLIGDVERSRLSEVRVLIFAGVNEGIVPHVQTGGGLLTDSDRENLLGASVKLKPSTREAAYIARFYLYTVLTKPSEKLYLSFSRTNGKGEARNPSYLIDVIRRMYPEIRTDCPEEDVLTNRMTLPENKAAALSILAGGFAEIPDRLPGETWKEIYLSLREDPDYAGKVQRLLEAAGKRSPSDQIGRAAAKALYGSVLVNSASRLETFCSCAFAHYLRYGLRLKERPEYLFTGLDFGNIMHRSLELFGKSLIGRDPGSLDFSDEEMRRYAEKCLQRAVDEAGPASVIQSSARDQYRIEKMQRLMNAAVTTLGGQLSAGDFVISAAEQTFRGNEELKSLTFHLEEGIDMTLTGKIDRMDTCESGDVTYVKIVDFKTGNTEFDPAKVYHGLQLQLMTYLNAAMELLRKQGKYPMPAGIFYQQVNDPVLGYKADEDSSELTARRLHDTMGSGLVLDDPEVIRLLDREAASSGKSDVIPVAMKKDGSLMKRSKAMSAADFAVMQHYTNGKILQTGKEMMAGDASVRPYRYGNEEACTWCSYRDVCLFDRRIAGYRYRTLEKMDRDEAVCRMQEACGDETSKNEEMQENVTDKAAESVETLVISGESEKAAEIFGRKDKGARE